MPDPTWKICSTCKKPLAFGQPYYLCSVSTCNHKKVGYFFCSVPCWDAHVPEARHRDAWAVKETAPTAAEWERQKQEDSQEEPEAPKRRIVAAASQPSAATSTSSTRSGEGGSASEDDVLIVVSKLKKYVRDRSEMNTSDTVFDVLSAHLRDLSKLAIRHAGEDGRKTVMDRDFRAVLEKHFRSS